MHVLCIHLTSKVKLLGFPWISIDFWAALGVIADPSGPHWRICPLPHAGLDLPGPRKHVTPPAGDKMRQVPHEKKEKRNESYTNVKHVKHVKPESKLVWSSEAQSLQAFLSLMCLLSKVQIAVPPKASGTPSCEQGGPYRLSQSALQLPFVQYDEFTGLMIAAFSSIPHLAKALRFHLHKATNIK